MAEEYKTKLQFNDCPVDQATEDLFRTITRSMTSQPSPYSASFEMEFKFNGGMASLTKKTAMGLTDDHTRMLSELEALGLKAVSRGNDGGKVKTEAEIVKV